MSALVPVQTTTAQQKSPANMVLALLSNRGYTNVEAKPRCEGIRVKIWMGSNKPVVLIAQVVGEKVTFDAPLP